MNGKHCWMALCVLLHGCCSSRTVHHESGDVVLSAIARVGANDVARGDFFNLRAGYARGGSYVRIALPLELEFAKGTTYLVRSVGVHFRFSESTVRAIADVLTRYEEVVVLLGDEPVYNAMAGWGIAREGLITSEHFPCENQAAADDLASRIMRVHKVR